MLYEAQVITCTLHNGEKFEKTTDNQLDELINIMNAVQNHHSTDLNKLEKLMIFFEQSVDFINQQCKNQTRITDNLIKHNSQ